MMPRSCLVILFAFVAACARFPELENAISAEARQSAYPRLEPVDELLAEAAPSSDRDAAAEIENLRARGRLLTARAIILRRTEVVDPESQARMKAAFDRLSR